MAISEQQLQTDLMTAGIIRAASLMSLMALLVICHIYAEQIQIGLDEQQRVVIRTILYVVAILTFPMMKFVRHVTLRLQKNDKPPKFRYLLAITVSMLISESIGIYGFIMYVLGDSYNTLYIFTMLSALAMFLYRPDKEEYKALFESSP
ncbi:MAG: hypothetical protein KAJ63_05940 [Methyloprofundus sp.]|nr:hypothetical protein [Methyloprofundus sp.]